MTENTNRWAQYVEAKKPDAKDDDNAHVITAPLFVELLNTPYFVRSEVGTKMAEAVQSALCDANPKYTAKTIGAMSVRLKAFLAILDYVCEHECALNLGSRGKFRVVRDVEPTAAPPASPAGAGNTPTRSTPPTSK